MSDTEDPIVSLNPQVQHNYENRVPLKEETCIHENLLPCPFCGGEPKRECYQTLTLIKCTHCGVGYSGHGPLSDKQLLGGICWLEIVGRWNQRST